MQLKKNLESFEQLSRFKVDGTASGNFFKQKGAYSLFEHFHTRKDHRIDFLFADIHERLCRSIQRREYFNVKTFLQCKEQC